MSHDLKSKSTRGKKGWLFTVHCKGTRILYKREKPYTNPGMLTAFQMVAFATDGTVDHFRVTVARCSSQHLFFQHFIPCFQLLHTGLHMPNLFRTFRTQQFILLPEIISISLVHVQDIDIVAVLQRLVVELVLKLL